jgi:hypothetical protein
MKFSSASKMVCQTSSTSAAQLPNQKKGELPQLQYFDEAAK